MSLSPRSIFLMVPVLGILIVGCGNWCNDCDEPMPLYRYVNTSNYTLIMSPPSQIQRDTLFIPNADSAEVGQSWLERSEFEHYKYVLRFRSLPESCLVFQGKIKNPILDIRWGNYNVDSARSTERRPIYRMVIGADHLQAASPCKVPRSTSVKIPFSTPL